MWNLVTLSGIWGVMSGICVPALWIFFITTGLYPELHEAPIQSTLHLIAEGMMAVVSMIAGWGFFAKRVWAPRLFLVALGIMLHAVFMSGGRLWQKGQWPFVAMFALIFVLSATLAVFHVRRPQP